MFRTRPALGATAKARHFRKNMTDAERRMWRILRECFPDARFRSQVPMLSYTLDFCSHRERAAIEVDGGQHGGPRDIERMRAIEREGYRVLRFWNHEVLGNADGVALAIDSALQQGHPHPNPPPSRGRAQEPSPSRGGERIGQAAWHA